jgi:hypothetical protein
MYAVGCILIFLAIKKNVEPALLLPMGFRGHSGQHPTLRRRHPDDWPDWARWKGILDWLFQGGHPCV